MTEPQLGGTYDQLLDAARWAEGKGLYGFARSDHYYSSRQPVPDATDAFATLAGLARDTSRIRLCVLVSPITFRHPAVIAKTAATIDQMSGGRFDLGVGTGWMELEHEAFGLEFPPTAERFERLVESLEYIKAAFSGESFRGVHYRFEGEAGPKPTGLRLIVGGSGPRRTPTLAGRVAGEYNTFLGHPPDIAPKIAAMRAAAEEAGRDPGSIRVSVMGPVFGAVDEAGYRAMLDRQGASRGIGGKDFEARMLDQGVLVGTPDRLGEGLAALAGIGVDHLYIQWLDLADREGLDEVWASVCGAAAGA